MLWKKKGFGARLQIPRLLQLVSRFLNINKPSSERSAKMWV
jgi:hypothetical protein